MDFSLFRVKVFRPTQKEMFTDDVSPQAILREAVLERPTLPLMRGYDWHIGNVEVLDDSGLYFALGRTARSKVSVLDTKTGDFAEREFESAPYTHVFADVAYELVAIAQKTVLAPNVNSIGRQLGRLLNGSRAARRHRVTFAVSEISEPEEFLRELQSAYAITSFTVTFTKPNPFDVNEEFLLPMERLAQAADGSSGSTTIRGRALNSEPLTDLTRSAAATGDNAVARIRLGADSRPVRRSLKGDTAKIPEDRIETREDKLTFLQRLRAKYDEIRGDGRASA